MTLLPLVEDLIHTEEKVLPFMVFYFDEKTTLQFSAKLFYGLPVVYNWILYFIGILYDKGPKFTTLSGET